ncbi:hypothetical protein [Taibaiella soli]|uniref:Uncharacterized protein n=1 Tax=Taibaiella soli TaxID=1649169 RepID=A0A2W2BCD1_9BACT|nr:hypothetical protein [Taibaiella soli]PZF73537.1 hypothetical protein DN068_07370 [Taibaiella soli]
MPINDLNQQLVNETTLTTVRATLQQVIADMQSAAQNSNLTPDERKRYGSINEQNKLLVNKVNDYATDHPSFRSPDVNWDDYQKHLSLRNHLAAIEKALEQIDEMCSDIRITYDYSLYQNALVDYDYTKYRAGSTASGAGFHSKYEDIKQLFGNPTGIKNIKQDTTNKPTE